MEANKAQFFLFLFDFLVNNGSPRPVQFNQDNCSFVTSKKMNPVPTFRTVDVPSPRTRIRVLDNNLPLFADFSLKDLHNLPI